MKNPIQILVIHDGNGNQNPLSLILAEELARCGSVHLTHLHNPPEKVLENTCVLTDDRHVSRWRRQMPNRTDAPTWLLGAALCYKIGPAAIISAKTIKDCAAQVLDDARSYLSGREVSKPQSAVRMAPAEVPPGERSLR